MGALSPILRSVAGGQVAFRCPGCGYTHSLPMQIREQRLAVPDPEDQDWTPPAVYYDVRDGAWSWNGDVLKPSFQPSILAHWHQWMPPVTPENMNDFKRAPWPQTKVESVCHSFVTDGRIQFLTDCTHALAGQTVDIPPWARHPTPERQER